MSSMRIAIDAREMVGTIAGKGRYVAELINGLAAIDSENTYYLYTKQPIPTNLPKNFINILIDGLPGLRQLWLAIDAKRRGCSVLLSPTGYLPIIFSFIPSVVTVHDLAPFVTKAARPTFKTLVSERLFLGLATRRSNKIVAVSDSTKHDLMEIFHVSAAKIITTPLGYDKHVYTPNGREDYKIVSSYGLKPDYLLFVGTLEPRKNITGIIRAYGQLPVAMRQRYPLAIAGKKGWFYEEIFSLAKELNLEKEIKFLGRVPDEHLPALYRQAKLFLFPSFYEGFGLPPLEALASGTPVVTSNTSSLPEVVGEAGVTIDPTNPDELGFAIRDLLADESKYSILQSKAVKQAVKFDWKTTARLTLKVLKSVGE